MKETLLTSSLLRRNCIQSIYKHAPKIQITIEEFTTNPYLYVAITDSEKKMVPYFFTGTHLRAANHY
jgi:hypothetical protein